MKKIPTALREAQLVRGLRQRDERALAALHRYYAKALYDIVFRVVKERELAEDILQDAFVKIWQHGAEYDPGKGRLFTWILNIARNLAIDKTRTRHFQNRKCLHSVPDSQHWLWNELQAYQPELIGLSHLLSRLGEEEQKLLERIYWQGYSGPEVALAFGWPLGTVKTRLRATIRKLRNSLPLLEQSEVAYQFPS